ncbi:hypothetical protein SAMN05421759_10457 [Roseivivax lentus]|uniref:Uncharacterized protein n=1 Tax=Roseivivax lentus TaxID=633194 RepID=A0A1N7M7P8_9RHOB|nr:hypothetical protein [Roseivivax lentus]SIS82094.1 hypothetical protein SAMN05421759_10457 [Roseivivax lentus]
MLNVIAQSLRVATGNTAAGQARTIRAEPVAHEKVRFQAPKDWRK